MNTEHTKIGGVLGCFSFLKTGYFQVNQPFVFGEGTFPETNSHDLLDRNLWGCGG